MVTGRRLVALRVIAVFCLVAFVVKYKMFACSDDYSEKLLRDTCSDFAHNKISGNMCHQLCTERQLEFTGCYKMKYEWGEVARQVYRGQLNGKSVWIKAKPYEFRGMGEVNDSLGLPELEQLTKDLVWAQLGTPGINRQGVGLVKKMWPVGGERYWLNLDNGGKMSKADVNTLWSLLQQKEYVITKYMDQTGNFAEIYGSCGHFYVMEDTPVFHRRHLAMLVGKDEVITSVPWGDRAQIALGIMDMIDTFRETIGDFHHCDITTQNLGVDTKGRVKIIDSDQAIFDGRMYSGDCQQHSDCDFMHCQGWCNPSHMKCTKNRTHLIMQQACQRIFLGHKDNYWVGLLRLPPQSIQERLARILEKCATRREYLDDRSLSAELVTVLKKSLQNL